MDMEQPFSFKLIENYMTKIKICGISTTKEAEMASKYGADYLGILIDIPNTNLSLSIHQAKNIISSFKTGRFIILTSEKKLFKLLEIVEKVSPWGIQLLRPTKNNVNYLISKSKVKVIPVIHVSGSGALKKARSFYNADFILLDSKSKNKLGGTGKTHDWEISKRIVEESPIPAFLAGGLNELNVISAIKKVSAFAVDAESSLRNESGYRNLEKIKIFISTIKNHDSRNI